MYRLKQMVMLSHRTVNVPLFCIEILVTEAVRVTNDLNSVQLALCSNRRGIHCVQELRKNIQSLFERLLIGLITC